MLSVCGGLPQGLFRERGQTTVAQGLDAGQVGVCVSTAVFPELFFKEPKASFITLLSVFPPRSKDP